MIAVFIVGEYEDTVAGNSTWSEGDWNGDGEFDSGDMITAFVAGGYEQPAGVQAVALGETWQPVPRWPMPTEDHVPPAGRRSSRLAPEAWTPSAALSPIDLMANALAARSAERGTGPVHREHDAVFFQSLRGAHAPPVSAGDVIRSSRLLDLTARDTLFASARPLLWGEPELPVSRNATNPAPSAVFPAIADREES